MSKIILLALFIGNLASAIVQALSLVFETGTILNLAAFLVNLVALLALATVYQLIQAKYVQP